MKTDQKKTFNQSAFPLQGELFCALKKLSSLGTPLGQRIVLLLLLHHLN